MKILVVGRGLDSLTRHDVGAFELDQAKALQTVGCDVVLAAVDSRFISHPHRIGLKEYVLDGIKVVYCSFPSLYFFPKTVSLARKNCAKHILHCLKKKNWIPDIIHGHFWSEGFVQCGIPFVYTEHSSQANISSASEEKNQKDYKFYSQLQRLICVSHGLTNNIQQRTGISSMIVPNIVDVHSFSYNPQNHENFVFVATGNLIPTKGMDLLLRSFSHLPNNCRLIIIGDGKERFALEQQAKDLQISERVIFKGILSRQEINQIYSQCDAFVLASHSETFGVSFVEAMIAGLPVIATRCGGPEDFVDSKNGILVSVNDESALFEAMQQMIQQIDTYDKKCISENTRKRFSPETIATQLTEIYKEVLSC